MKSNGPQKSAGMGLVYCRKSFTIIHATIPWLVEAMLALLVPQKVGVPSRLVFTFVTHKLLLFVLGVLVGIQMVVGFVFLFT